MLKIAYKATFLKKFNKLPPNLQDEAREKIEIFREDPFHPFLKAHKLHGRMDGMWSFSINYEYRIIFQYILKDEVALLAIGNHDIYK